MQPLNTSYLLDHFIPFCQIDINLRDLDLFRLDAGEVGQPLLSGYLYVLFCVLCFLIHSYQNKHMNSILPLAEGH